jgi:hypothetical protein
MESGHPAQGDILQVIPRRPSGGAPSEGGGTGSRRLVWLPARRRKLTRIVIGAVAACALILVAAGVAHMLRPNQDSAAFAATGNASAAAPPALTTASPPAATTAPTATTAPSPPVPDAPQTGTLHLLRPAAPGKVWLDGQKLTLASATVSCGDHQLKVGHAKAHTVTIPCGGDLKVSR